MQVDHVDLNEVALFVEVVKAGGFAAAARRLGVPPSRISRRIRQLEDAMNTLLLSRSTRKIALTASGAQLLERCAEPLEQVRRASVDIARGATVATGQLRVSAPADLLEFFPMAWFREFLVDYPGVRLELLLGDANVDLIEQRIDVALRDVPETEAPRYRQLCPPVSTLVASDAYLAGHGWPARPGDLAEHACLTLRQQVPTVRWRLSGPQGQVEVAVRGPLSANHAGTLLRAAIEGFGIALLPVALTAKAMERGELREILPGYRRDDRGLGGGLFAVVPSERNIPIFVTAFVDFVSRRLAAGAISNSM